MKELCGTPFFKAYLYAGVELVTLTFDQEMVFGDFYTELGSWLKKYSCFEPIWTVNVHTVRDNVWKYIIFRIIDLDLWPNIFQSGSCWVFP